LNTGRWAGVEGAWSMSANPLVRSRRHRLLGGVCGGIAQWLGWNPTAVRILYVVVSIVSVAFPGIIVYLALWLLMPEER
jgi:phage shock protein PspC (stress-responsive transcriptional regulator)